jgi:hypothetical protein
MNQIRHEVGELSKKSRTVSNWELCIICQISCNDTLSNASEKGKCTLFKAVGLRKDDGYKNWYKTILTSTQNKHKVYHKTNLNNNIKLQVFRNIYRTKLFRNISCLFRSEFLYRCGHFNLSLIANQTISDSFLEMCSSVTFAHSLSKKSRTVSNWELCIYTGQNFSGTFHVYSDRY